MWRIGSAASCSESAEPSEEIASNPRDFFNEYTFHDVYYVNSQTIVRLAEIKCARTLAEVLGMLRQLPKYTPTLPVLLAEIGNPPLDAVACTFGVTVTTIRKWMKHGAPKPVLLSLWWLTRWGQSELDCELANRAAMYQALTGALQQECDRLHAQVEKLQLLGDFGAANDPLCLDGANTSGNMRETKHATDSQDTRPPLVFLVKR